MSHFERVIFCWNIYVTYLMKSQMRLLRRSKYHISVKATKETETYENKNTRRPSKNRMDELLCPFKNFFGVSCSFFRMSPRNNCKRESFIFAFTAIFNLPVSQSSNVNSLSCNGWLGKR